jgi:hypothetical protein
MNATTIKAMLRAAVFTGAIGVLPHAALADSGNKPTDEETSENVPDHAEAQSRGVGATTLTTEEKKSRAPDHATVESRGRGAKIIPNDEKTSRAPDHATVENRGAETNDE